MSSSTGLPELAPHAQPRVLSDRHSGGIRLLLGFVFFVLSHLASHRGDGVLAALAIGDVVLIALLRPLLLLRPSAWMALAGCAGALAWLSHSPYALLPLLLVPVVLIGLVGYGFGRTLLPGRVPLIARMVAGLDAMPASALPPELRDYTRRLTWAWAILLTALALANLVLASVVVPHGLLASLGVASPIAVSQTLASWLGWAANLGVMCGFFLAEFAVRQRRFPGRYRNLLDFFQQMGRLGPAFWRDVMH